MKKRTELIHDALLSSSAMGSMDTLRMDGHGPDFDSIRAEAIAHTATELTDRISQSLKKQELFDADIFVEWAQNKLEESWPGVYGEGQGREHLNQDLRQVMEQALRGLYKTFGTNSPCMQAVYETIRRIES